VREKKKNKREQKIREDMLPPLSAILKLQLPL
jgi:hypothetical protein